MAAKIIITEETVEGALDLKFNVEAKGSTQTEKEVALYMCKLFVEDNNELIDEVTIKKKP